MEAICFSKTSIDTRRTTRGYIQEDYAHKKIKLIYI
jgi:hypothetical protein